VSIFLSSQQGFEEAGPCAAGVKNMPVACFLGRGRIHVHPDASKWMWTDVHNWLQHFSMTSKVYIKNKEYGHPKGVLIFSIQE